MRMILAVGLLYTAFMMLRYVPSKPTLLRIFMKNGCCFVKCFFLYVLTESYGSYPFIFFQFFFQRLFIFGTERDRAWTGEGQRERETQNRKQAPGSEPSAQSPTRGSNSQTARSWPGWSRTLNQLRHPGAPPGVVFLICTCNALKSFEMALVIHLTLMSNILLTSVGLLTHVKCPDSGSWTCAADRKHSKSAQESRGVKCPPRKQTSLGAH